MFTNQLFTLFFAITLGMRYVRKFFLATSILASVGLAVLPAPKPFTYPVSGNIDGRQSELNQCVRVSPRTPFIYYSLNGSTVIRRSELGPLTDPVESSLVDNSLRVTGPGHDFGIIDGESVQAMSQATSLPNRTPFIYTISGYTIIRRSELGPLSDPVENSPADKSLRVTGPGHDFGAIDGEAVLGVSLPSSNSSACLVNGK